VIHHLEGQLTGTILGEEDELQDFPKVIDALQNRVGRIIFNGVPTGVEVCPAMLHGGPYPSSTDSRFTAVGIHAVKRWVRPFSFQSWPNELLPNELKNENPLGITRFVNGENTKNKV
ncbi:MAG: alpha-ketoglutaric semialdehyde dehydrogenase, partial [Flavobacteriaceae bacterium]